MVVDFANLTEAQAKIFFAQRGEVVAEYNQLSERLLDEDESLSWALNNVTSRNTFFSNLLYRMRCIRLLETLAQEEVIEEVRTDDFALANCLRGKYRISGLGRRAAFGGLATIIKRFRSIGKMVVWSLAAILCRSTARKRFHAVEKTIDIDIFCEREDPAFTDRYYGNIAERFPTKLKAKAAFVVFYLPVPRRRQIMRIASTAPISVVYWWDYLCVIDYAVSLWRVCRPRIPVGAYFYCGIDMTPLLKRVARDSINIYFFWGFLQERFVYRLKCGGHQITKYIDWYENQSYDRAFYWAMNRYYEGVYTCAYLGFVNDISSAPHVIPSNAELRRHLAPEKICVCNQRYAELLSSYYGYVEVVPFYRSQKIWSVSRPSISFNPCIVLVPTGLDDHEVRHKVGFFADLVARYAREDVRIRIKPHPSYPEVRLRSLIKNVPAIEIVDGNIYDRLQEASVTIASNSTTTYEALALGIPIIQLCDRRGVRVVENPLPGSPLWADVSNVEEFLTVVEHLRNEAGVNNTIGIKKYFFAREDSENRFRLFSAE